MRLSRPMTAGLVVAAGLILAVTYGGVVSADNAWKNYHWARTAASFDLTVVNSTTSDWDDPLDEALAG